MTDLPLHLLPLQFDHDAAFRASWALDELVARVDLAATNRGAAAEHILGSCDGPYADHLRHQVVAAGGEAGFVVANLRQLQRQIEDAREAALIEDVRRQLAADDWRQAQERAGRDEREFRNVATPVPAPVLPS